METDERLLDFIMRWMHVTGVLLDRRLEPEPWKYKLRYVWGHLVRIYSLIFVIQMSHVYWHDVNIEKISDNTSDLLAYIPTMAILASFYCSSEDFFKLVKQLEELYMFMKSSKYFIDHIYIGEKRLRFCKKISRYYITYTLTAGSLYAITPIFRPGFEITTEKNETMLYRPLAMNLWPNFQKIDPAYYAIDYVMQLLALLMLTISTTVESFCVTLIIFVTSIFEVLIRATYDIKTSKTAVNLNRRRNFGFEQKGYGKIETNFMDKQTCQKVLAHQEINEVTQDNMIEMGKRLMVIVKCHQELIRNVELLSKLLSPLLLSHLVISSTSMCLNGYIIIVSENTDIPTILARAFATSFVMGRVGIYCYLGTRLTSKSEEAGVAAYSGDWYTHTSKQMKFNTLMMINRSQKELVLTAGGFAKLSLGTFGSILQASYSYLTLLRKANSS